MFQCLFWDPKRARSAKASFAYNSPTACLDETAFSSDIHRTGLQYFGARMFTPARGGQKMREQLAIAPKPSVLHRGLFNVTNS
jgi:hypothetical protein